MPQIVTKNIKAQNLKAGQVVNGATVAQVEPKIKWTIVHFTDGTKIRVESANEFEVDFTEDTPEEKHALMVAYVENKIVGGVFKASATVDGRKRRVVESLAKDWIDGDAFENLLQADADLDWYRRIAIRCARLEERVQAGEFDGVRPTFLEIVNGVYDEAKRFLIELRQDSGWSGGHSMHNMKEQIARKAASDFCRDMSWSGLEQALAGPKV